ncbi:MAG: cupin domain-containing protein [Candidatus Izemoplasma sp.]
MIVGNMNEMIGKAISDKAAKDASIKVLVSKNEGWESHVMRVIDVAQDGHTPKHSHSWPHINYIIEGEGELMIDGKLNVVSAGSYAYIPSDTLHQFRNIGKSVFKFICIVPQEGHVY